MSDVKKPGLMRRLKGLMLKHMHRMITCKEFEDFIISYLDGTLHGAQLQMFEWHLQLCRECREYLAAYQRAMEAGKSVLSPAQEAIPENVPEDLIKAVLASRDA